MWPSRSKIKTDIANATPKPLNYYHQTTSDYFKPYISDITEWIPGRKVNLQVKDFVRLEPMVVPVMGAAKIRHMIYFVPMRLLQRSFNSFINDELHSYEDAFQFVNKVRTFTMDSLYKVFVHKNDNELCEPADNADFTIYGIWEAGTPQEWTGNRGYKFTKKGRWMYNIMIQLGYKIDFKASSMNYNISAMPLLAIAKIYVDYIKNTQYNYSTELREVENILCRNSSDNQDLNDKDIRSILNLFSIVNYDNDIFVSAFDRPAGPNEQYQTNYVINDITNNGLVSEKSHIVQLSNGTPKVQRADDSTYQAIGLTQYILTALHKLSDFMMRNQIVGHDKLQKFLAQYGVTPRDEQMNLCKFITKFETQIHFDDIFSTADTDGAPLGQFAGRGYAINNSNFTFSSDEHGYLIDIAVIIPKIGYYQGMSKDLFHINRLDFWNPTFDALGNSPVPVLTLLTPTGLENGFTTQQNIDFYDKIFGFLPKDYEYKMKMSKLSGNFVFDSINSGLDAWHLFRKVDGEAVVGQPDNEYKHNFRFTETFDREQYDRAFASSDQDNFIIITTYNGEFIDNSKDLYDTYDYESVGKELTVELSGTNKVTEY